LSPLKPVLVEGVWDRVRSRLVPLEADKEVFIPSVGFAYGAKKIMGICPEVDAFLYYPF
jgi:hypothetical protein